MKKAEESKSRRGGDGQTSWKTRQEHVFGKRCFERKTCRREIEGQGQREKSRGKYRVERFFQSIHSEKLIPFHQVKEFQWRMGKEDECGLMEKSGFQPLEKGARANRLKVESFPKTELCRGSSSSMVFFYVTACAKWKCVLKMTRGAKV